jgi:hypothetical protein
MLAWIQAAFFSPRSSSSTRRSKSAFTRAAACAIHPCKIYNILALGTPFLYIGPYQSHVRDLIAEDGLQADSYCAAHGDVGAGCKYIACNEDSRAAGSRPF